MNNDIEQTVLKCTTCEKYRSANKKEPMIPHSMPDRSFQKIAADLCDF